MECFLPLEHLDLSFQAIAVLGNYGKLRVAQVFTVLGHACDVYQVIIIVFVRATLIHGDAGHACSNDQLLESNSLTFVFPEQYLGERD